MVRTLRRFAFLQIGGRVSGRIGRVSTVWGFAGLLAVGMLTSEAVVAFQGGWQGPSGGTAKRLYFRPVAAASRQAPSNRWRPQQRISQPVRSTRHAGRVAYPLGLPAPAASSSFSVVPRGVSSASDSLGRQFRPQVAGPAASLTQNADSVASVQGLQSRFRPASNKRKQPYELSAAGRNNIQQPYAAAYVSPRYMPVSSFAGHGIYWPLH